jgi:hypothetical protein
VTETPTTNHADGLILERGFALMTTNEKKIPRAGMLKETQPRRRKINYNCKWQPKPCKRGFAY